MGLWSRLLRRWKSDADEPEADDAAAAESAPARNTVELPTEPFVFECQSCGKVFEARRKRDQCPECDSTEVALMSE